MPMIKSKIFMVRQIIQHLGWVGVSDEKIRQLAFRFNADQLNAILRRAEIKRCT